MKKAKATKLIQHVKFLTELRPFRNYQNIDSLRKVESYIEDSMRESGMSPVKQSWIAEGNEYNNMMCSYLPEKQKRTIIGAHYDVYGNQPGADDNASAIAGLLETIRIVSETKPELDFGIDFVAYCLEEPPFFGTELMGSYIHAKSVSGNKENILGMICYEMIGYFSDVPGSQNFPHPALEAMFPNTGNFIMAVGIEKYGKFNDKVFEGMKDGAEIDVQKINMPEGLGLADMSDQRNYWKFDIPAMMVNDTSFMRNPHYHKMSDNMDTLDFNKMAEVVNCVTNSISNLA
ncbi:MAG: M28 family peptidase [Flavobacteriales bacterium]